MASKRGKQTLYQRIALDGGEELRKEMEALGPEGAAAFKLIQKAVDNANRELTGFQKLVVAVQQDFRTIQRGAATVGKGFDTIASGVQSFAVRATILTGAVTGLSAGMFALVKNASDVADETGKAAESAGLTIEQYQKLAFVFKQGNLEAGQMATAFKTLNGNIADAADGSGKGADLFRQLGVSVKNADGSLRSADSIIKDLAARFQRLPDGAAKSDLAVKLFGRSGAALVPILSEGADEMARLSARFDELGLSITEADAKIGDAFGDSLGELIATIGALRTKLGLIFAPSFTQAITGITDLIAANSKEIQAFATTLATQVGPLVQDFINILKGDDSAVVNQNLLAIRDTILSVGAAFQTIGGVLSFVFQTLEQMLQPLVDVFNAVSALFGGPQITAGGLIITALVTWLLGGFRLLGATIKGVGLIWEGLVTIFGTTTAQIVGAVVGLDAALNAISILLSNMVSFVAGKFVEGFQAALQAVGQFFADFGFAVAGVFQSLLSPVQSVIDTITGWVQGLLNLVKSLINAIFGAQEATGGGGPAAQENAAGGHITGPGTGTSDSILSWLSNGEYVIKAKAVRKLGVGFLNALNAGRMPHFANGGLATAMPRMSLDLPALATGGPAPAGRPLSLTIGGETFDGLIAPEQVASKFIQFATTKKLRSTGSKPRWKQ